MEECGGSTASKPPFRQMKPQSEIVDLPSTDQLKTLFFASAAPMVGFGFMDNFIMIQAGGLIDSTLGVKFGLATLTAAAMGQICSDVSGVVFGGVVERALSRIGFNPPSLSQAQRKLPLCRNVSMAGAVIGVICGCLLGASTLMFMDLESGDRQRRSHEMFDAWNQMVDQCHAIGARYSTIYSAGGDVGVAIPQSGIVRDCAESGIILRCERYNFESTPPTMCVPVLTSDGKVVAVVEFKEKKIDHDVFTEDDEKLAEMLASHMSIIFMTKMGDSLNR